MTIIAKTKNSDSDVMVNHTTSKGVFYLMYFLKI